MSPTQDALSSTVFEQDRQFSQPCRVILSEGEEGAYLTLPGLMGEELVNQGLEGRDSLPGREVGTPQETGCLVDQLTHGDDILVVL